MAQSVLEKTLTGQSLVQDILQVNRELLELMPHAYSKAISEMSQETWKVWVRQYCEKRGLNPNTIGATYKTFQDFSPVPLTPAQKQQSENTPSDSPQIGRGLGNIIGAAVVLATRGLTTAEPEGMEQDQKYKKIFSEVLDEWKKDHPQEQAQTNRFIKTNYGIMLENPLHIKAQKLFEEKHPELFKKYQEKEKTRIYKKPSQDPELVRLNNRIKQRQIERDNWKKTIAEKPDATLTDLKKPDEHFNQTKNQELKDFVENFNEKATAYASMDWNDEDEQKRSDENQNNQGGDNTNSNISSQDIKDFIDNINNEQEFAESGVGEAGAEEGAEAAGEELGAETGTELAGEELGAETGAELAGEGLAETTSFATEGVMGEGLAAGEMAATEAGIEGAAIAGAGEAVAGEGIAAGFGGTALAGGAVVGAEAAGGAAAAGSAAGAAAAGAAAGTGAVAAVEATPVGWIITIVAAIIILLAIVIIIVMTQYNDNQNASPAQTGQSQQIPGLTLKLSTEKSKVENGTDILYTVSGSYDGTKQLTLRDPMPTDANNKPYGEFTGANGSTTKSSSLITWSINGPAHTFSFSFTLHPTQNDVTVKNTVFADLIGKSSTQSTQSIADSTDFDAIVSQQGRNTGILGDVTTFTNTVVQNGSSYSLASKKDYVQSIYNTAVASNINPLVALTIWGVEASFSTNGTEFGCNPFGSGFDSQLSCSVNTLNHWISVFERDNKNGSLTISGTNCAYTDSLAFAYEKYTPVCAVYDQNDNSRTNFVRMFKQLAGK